ncbi:FtsX-like permease family protein [Kitasatospora sp. SolWspMP-SS2h]|uniref:FtsX-like permease family protein n=1 Tax=Kitasatospora sp. SolWspMP-SS2h TaxID=1305729 RepID=UPI000DC02230|nr:FtsX-like permease family protein [Kitasatospora sp. SolWspMP-SS2h]RAJ29690.1 FtsX-like permease family protein [Kitasatospora sp. SolWspMP-SS2h]
MITVILDQLRRRRGRALALAAGILVAATSFTLLTATVSTSQAATVGTVRDNARSAYDVLVRPPDSQTDVERQSALVAPNFLSGTFGGITTDQYDRIRGMAGVDVAAPVANIGYLMVASTVTVDVSRFLDGDASRQILRITPTLTSGLGSYRTSDEYVYLTRSPLTSGSESDGLFESDTLEAADADEDTERYRINGKYDVCFYFNWDKTGGKQFGLNLPLKPNIIAEDLRDRSPFDPDLSARMNCQSGRDKATIDIPVSYPVLLSAIDPVAEDRLVGLGGTIASGRMLSEQDEPWEVSGAESVHGQRDIYIPALLSDNPLTTGTLDATVERLDVGDPAELPSKLGNPAADGFVRSLRGTPVGTTRVDLSAGYRRALEVDSFDTGVYWTVGPVTYRRTPGGGLAAQPQPPQEPGLWITNSNKQPFRNVPEENHQGVQYREVTSHASTDCIGLGSCEGVDSGRLPNPFVRLVGRYDTGALPGFSPLSETPLETYQPPQVTGADSATRAKLHDEPLLPDRSLGGYVSPPPTMLTTMDSITALTGSRRVPGLQDEAPLSAIRIRVAGVTGVDTASRARVNAVAGEIRAAYPLLQVDVTVGSSPAPRTVVLADSVQVTERWVAKGVALRILRAVDTKSAVLFVLVLVVCALFLGQAALASVRSRRTEIGTLRCLGWSGGEVLRLVLGELVLIGLAAGAAGAVLAYVLGGALGQPDAGAKSLLVLPVALLLATAAGLVPAWLATRMGPMEAVRPPVTPARRARPVRSVAGLAALNLLRVRGRTLLGAAGLALGVAAFTVLLALTLAFRGEVAGSLLGSAVVAQARGADYLSVALSLVLGAAGAVDVLVISQRERAADLAVLRATGWTNRELAKLTLHEGIGLALLGGLSGAVAGLAGVLALGRGVLHGHLLTVTGAALLATLAATALVVAALAVPIRGLSRISAADLAAAD